ncbi:hypothetical protein [Nonomuraea sp. B19D2]|uniref:hypothetical protein n=1 Tax=Nonomuraea sp. B19D2 TaxID=3159561 RepID=UPI0032DAEC11
MDRHAGLNMAVDLIEEVAEVDGTMARWQLADHLAGGGIERGSGSVEILKSSSST